MSITIGAGLDVLGTIALALTGLRYGSHLTGWDLAPATALIGLGQGMALPSLIGTALARVPPERAGAAAGILTTTQQFGVASGVAIIGAVFYDRLGPGRASSVSAMVLAMTIDAVVVLAAAALTLLLPRRAATRLPRDGGAGRGARHRGCAAGIVKIVRQGFVAGRDQARVITTLEGGVLGGVLKHVVSLRPAALQRRHRQLPGLTSTITLVWGW